MPRKQGLAPAAFTRPDLPERSPALAVRRNRRAFTLADQVNALVSASEADPDLGFMARLMALFGNPHLLASHPASAPLSAVDLPPVAASADVKPHSATRPSAKQLDLCHFAGHTPHDSIAACEPCRVGGDAGGIDLGLGGVGEWTERIGRKHEC